MSVGDSSVDENSIAPEQHTILTLEIAGPVSVMRAIMESADGGPMDPFLNFLAYLHAQTQNMSLNIRAAYMEDLDDAE